MSEIERPKRPPATSKQAASCLPIALAGTLLVMSLAVLFVLSIGLIGPVVVVACLMFAMVGFHYVVWGWWLGAMIQKEDELEQHDDEADRRDEESGAPWNSE